MNQNTITYMMLMQRAPEVATALIPLHKRLGNGSLKDAGGVLLLLARQHRRDSEADPRARFDELPHAEAGQNPHTIREHLVHDILQHTLLACQIEDGDSCRTRLVEFGVAEDGSLGERKWMYMIGKAAFERIA